VKIKLSAEEIFQGAAVGCMRMTKAIKRGNNTINDPDHNMLWQYHVEGALAEMAFAKAMNRYWSSGDVHDVDVGHWEIRQTPKPKSKAKLVVRERDKQLGKMDKPFALVCGRYGEYEIAGWMMGHDCQVLGELKDPTGTGRPKAYFIPAENLKSMEDVT
jgi:hypothetical protein